MRIVSSNAKGRSGLKHQVSLVGSRGIAGIATPSSGFALRNSFWTGFVTGLVWSQANPRRRVGCSFIYSGRPPPMECLLTADGCTGDSQKSSSITCSSVATPILKGFLFGRCRCHLRCYTGGKPFPSKRTYDVIASTTLC
jgi:hypothetical protein